MNTPWKPGDRASTAPLPPLGVAGLITQTFRLLFARFGTLFPLAFVPALVLSLLSWGTSVPLPADFDPAVDPLPLPSFAEIITGLLSTVMGFFIIGFMCLAALDAVIGKTHTIGEYTRQTLTQILPIGVLGVLVSIMVGIGAIFFVLPGLYVLARYLPWVEAVVFENAGWSGLGRAQRLTEGYRWPLVGAVVAMGAIVIVIVLVVSPVVFMLAGSGILLALFEAVVAGFYYALIAIFTALVYARLREVKEGMTIPQIAATIG